MIAAGIFTMAGIVAWQNVVQFHDSHGNEGASFLFFWVTVTCFVVAGLCASGTIVTS